MPWRNARPIRLAAMAASVALIAGCGSAAPGGSAPGGSGGPASANPAASSTGAATASPGAAAAWTPIVPDSMAGATLTDAVAYSVGFVAVGAAADVGSRQQGGIWTSSDGSDWKAVAGETFSDAHVESITRAGDGVLAAGERCSGECTGLLMWGTSDPGSWADPVVPNGGAFVLPTAVLSHGPFFVTISIELVDASQQEFNGRVFTSPDGDVWTAAPDVAAMHDSRLAAIASGPNGYVVVGTATAGATRNGAAWTSSDAISWKRATDDPSFAGAILASVAAGGPGYVAVGSIGANGAVWTSTDGTTWKHVDDGGAFTGRPLADIAASAKGLVIVGNDATGGRVWTSTDGTAWRDLGPVAGADTGKFVAVTIGIKNTMILGRALPGSTPAGLLWSGPLPG